MHMYDKCSSVYVVQYGGGKHAGTGAWLNCWMHGIRMGNFYNFSKNIDVNRPSLRFHIYMYYQQGLKQMTLGWARKSK